MNTKLVVALVVVVLAALASVVIFKGYPRLSPAPPPVPAVSIPDADEPQKTVDVTAQNGLFTPKEFQVQLFDTLYLNITAQDQNYYFQVAGYPRLDTQLPQGQTTTVKIQSLGIGEYPFTCGNGCAGKITVEQEKDAED